VHKDQQVQQDIQVRKEQQDLREMREPRGQQGIQVHKELQDLQDHKVLKGL